MVGVELDPQRCVDAKTAYDDWKKDAAVDTTANDIVAAAVKANTSLYNGDDGEKNDWYIKEMGVTDDQATTLDILAMFLMCNSNTCVAVAELDNVLYFGCNHAVDADKKPFQLFNDVKMNKLSMAIYEHVNAFEPDQIVNIFQDDFVRKKFQELAPDFAIPNEETLRQKLNVFHEEDKDVGVDSLFKYLNDIGKAHAAASKAIQSNSTLQPMYTASCFLQGLMYMAIKKKLGRVDEATGIFELSEVQDLLAALRFHGAVCYSRQADAIDLWNEQARLLEECRKKPWIPEALYKKMEDVENELKQGADKSYQDRCCKASELVNEAIAKVTMRLQNGGTKFDDVVNCYKDLMEFVVDKTCRIVFTEDNTIDSRKFDLHCEKKVFIGLTQLGKATGGVNFAVSKPCCLGCTAFFFGGHVKEEDRPKFKAVCSSHYERARMTGGEFGNALHAVIETENAKKAIE